MFMANSRPIDGVRTTVRMPARLSPNVSCRPCGAAASSSLTTTASTIAIRPVTAATSRKLARQPMVAVENASGAVAISVPMVPRPICRPASVANRSAGNRLAKIASGAISDADAPSPSKARARMSPPGEVADANSTAPATVMPAQTTRQRRGPNRSSAMPSGSWTAANAKKKALDSVPISAGERPSSAARLGAMTPTELRRNWLTM